MSSSSAPDSRSSAILRSARVPFLPPGRPSTILPSTRYSMSRGPSHWGANGRLPGSCILAPISNRCRPSKWMPTTSPTSSSRPHLQPVGSGPSGTAAGPGPFQARLLSVTDLLHYPALDERAKNLYACWQLGPYGNGIRVEFANLINGSWTEAKPVPGSAHATYCDVAADPFGIAVFYVWDGVGDIWCRVGRTGTVPDNEPPTAEFVFSPATASGWKSLSMPPPRGPDGVIASYSWDFGDGSRGRAVTPHLQKLGHIRGQPGRSG
jgi:hypothetical protein